MAAERKLDYLKAGCLVAMAVYGIVMAADAAEGRFLDRVDLVIHEAGHLLFGWFGTFPGVVGGTIGQLFVPAAFAVYFHLRREFFSSAMTLFWVGQNLLNISVYVKDAQAMAMPLVSVGGGGDVIHDWNYILLRVGLLRWDKGVGNAVFFLGVLVMLAAIAWGACHSTGREEREDGGAGRTA